MSAVLTYALPGALAQANAIRALLVNSKLRLFKTGIDVSNVTSRAELLANECDFTGYPSGGITIANWTAPLLADQTGYFITSGNQQFAFTGTLGTGGNQVGGFWVELADTTLYLVGQFGDPQPMVMPGAGLPLTVGTAVGQG